MTEYRRILLDGAVVEATRVDDRLIVPDGRTVEVNDAVNMPPCQPSDRLDPVCRGRLKYV